MGEGLGRILLKRYSYWCIQPTAASESALYINPDDRLHRPPRHYPAPARTPTTKCYPVGGKHCPGFDSYRSLLCLPARPRKRICVMNRIHNPIWIHQQREKERRRWREPFSFRFSVHLRNNGRDRFSILCLADPFFMFRSPQFRMVGERAALAIHVTINKK